MVHDIESFELGEHYYAKISDGSFEKRAKKIDKSNNVNAGVINISQQEYDNAVKEFGHSGGSVPQRPKLNPDLFNVKKV